MSRTYKDANGLSLLSNLNRVECPFVKVKIGDYVFGVHDEVTSKKGGYSYKSVANLQGIQYPDYVQSLQVEKINGEVNKYTLQLKYTIGEHDDPNRIDKILGSISKTRKMYFSYGDMSSPSFVYRDEEVLYKDAKQNFDTQNPCITYTISAVSSANLLTSGYYSFPAKTAKPSDEIKTLLKADKYGLLDVFTGMRGMTDDELSKLILGNDASVVISAKTNISVLDYISYLVSLMVPANSPYSTVKNGSMFSMVIVDNTKNTIPDIAGLSRQIDGPYFKIVQVNKEQDDSTTYEVDIGVMSQNIVLGFTLDDNESYAILYDFQGKISNGDYAKRIGNDGKLYDVYAPALSSNNNLHMTREEDKSWWTKITQYPIKATLTLKGLLRPALLMTKVRLKLWYWGKKHNASGLYVVTKQVDTIDFNGYKTVLSLQRIAGDNGTEGDGGID